MKLTKRERGVLDELKGVTKKNPIWVCGDSVNIAVRLAKRGVLNHRVNDDTGNTEFWVRGEGESVVSWDDSLAFMVYGDHVYANGENFVYLKIPGGLNWRKVVLPAMNQLLKKVGRGKDVFTEGIPPKQWKHQGDKHLRFEFVKSVFGGEFTEVKP